MGKIVSHKDLVVYQRAFAVSMQIFNLTKAFPKEERYSLTDQVRRSSRSVCANLAEAWRRRRYTAAFIAKLNDAEGEAAETQTWLDYALQCEYLHMEQHEALSKEYEEILRMLVSIINHPENWVIKEQR